VTKSATYYFAYGSNLYVPRITARVPSAVPEAIGYVGRYTLAFHKRSIDGSAKADAFYTEKANDRIWGAVYRIHLDEQPLLDKHEFLGVGYNRVNVNVVTAGETSMEAWMYVARTSAIDTSLRPYGWYLEYVVRGAHQHRLPLCHISKLYQIETLRDPDPDREASHEPLLSRQ
jgi:gamma-glutamylcyclotransferase (GGCT)/AIG2-like uncharacterized protein YtfP